MSIIDLEECWTIACKATPVPPCATCVKRVCAEHSHPAPELSGSRVCDACFFCGRPGRVAQGHVVTADRPAAPREPGGPQSPLGFAFAGLSSGQRPLSDEEKVSFCRTLLDEVLTVQDKKVRAAVDEFLGRVTAPKAELKVGSKRVEVEPARFLRPARFDDRPTLWSGWIVYNGSSWTCDGPLTAGSTAVFLRDDGAIFARAGEAGGLLSRSNKDLSEHHQVAPHPDDTSSRGMHGKLPVWCMRTAGANLGLPLNVHVHNQVHPEISVGRWCSGTANALTVHRDFDELTSADATATSTWFIRRLAAVLDDPHTRREFWGRPI